MFRSILVSFCQERRSGFVHGVVLCVALCCVFMGRILLCRVVLCESVWVVLCSVVVCVVSKFAWCLLLHLGGFFSDCVGVLCE